MSGITNRPIGIIGTGSFGTAIAKLVAENNQVLMYSRNETTVDSINNRHTYEGVEYLLPDNITATASEKELCDRCKLILPIVPSEHFRTTIQKFAAYLTPHHFLIHATKGLDIFTDKKTEQQYFYTMSEIIAQESNVLRTGVLSGPNLAKEIMEEQPAATLIASKFDEVIKAGQDALRGKYFQVYGSHDMRGAELAGALKNIIAIGSGIINGKGYGKNSWALLISRGLVEMVTVGKALGADINAFLGIAGIGDLVATAASENSRNFTLGYKLGKGMSIDDVIESSSELAEGYYTIKVVNQLIENKALKTPIITMIYKVLYEGIDVDKAISALMSFNHDQDVQFI